MSLDFIFTTVGNLPVDETAPHRAATFRTRTSIGGVNLLLTFRWLRRVGIYQVDVATGDGTIVRQWHLTHTGTSAVLRGIRTRIDPEFPDIIIYMISKVGSGKPTPTTFHKHRFMAVVGREVR